MVVRALLFLLLIAGPAFGVQVNATGGYWVPSLAPRPPIACTDADSDGFGTEPSAACDYAGIDCNDASASVYPGAAETADDGIDQDCNGSDLVAGGALRVFPGAMGYGTTTPAGRGGQVLRVTSLLDNGATGTLREVLSRNIGGGARVIAFEVSGTIQLNSDIVLTTPYVTIAGQTAPSPGVTVARYTFSIQAHDVLVQHMRFRLGDSPCRGVDAVNIEGGAKNIVLDHCSISWGVDENLGIKHIEDVTVSNSIVSEGLQNSCNSKGSHSKGVLMAYDTRRATFLRNLLAHNDDRHPNFKDGSIGMSVNNVYYNWGYRAGAISNPEASTYGALDFSSVGDVYNDGLDSSAPSIIYLHSSVVPPSKVYITDTVKPSGTPLTSGTTSALVESAPAWEDSIVTLAGSATQAHVLANAGARPADRDSVDARIVADVTAGTGRIIDSPSEVGGFPSLAQNTRSLTAGALVGTTGVTWPASPSGDADGDGYTNLEEALHQLAALVE